MQFGVEDIENLLITFVICDYGFQKKRFWKDKDLRRFTPLHNPSNGVQHFVWNCQNKWLYEESSINFHHWIFFLWKDTFFQQKIIPSSNEKLEKKMQNLGETFLLICDFLHYVECNALGSKTSQKRGHLLLGIPQSKAIHHLA
jgi:hypothetical protein